MRICHFQKRSALTPRGWLVGARALLPARTTFPLITTSAASSDRAPECHLVHSTEQPARQTPLLSLLPRGRKPAPSLTSSATALLSAIGTSLLSTGPLWGQVEPFHIQAPPVTSQVGTSSGSFRRQTGFSLETSAPRPAAHTLALSSSHTVLLMFQNPGCRSRLGAQSPVLPSRRSPPTVTSQMGE